MKNRKELFETICEKDVEFDEAWNAFTPECGQFVRKLLTRDYKKRLTAQDAMKHPWIANNLQVLYFPTYIFSEFTGNNINII